MPKMKIFTILIFRTNQYHGNYIFLGMKIRENYLLNIEIKKKNKKKIVFPLLPGLRQCAFPNCQSLFKILKNRICFSVLEKNKAQLKYYSDNIIIILLELIISALFINQA